MRLRLMIGLSSSLVIGACGGPAGAETEAETEAETTTSGGEGQASTEASADVAWANMDRAQRLVFMQQTVMPEMQAMFQEHDPERFADFGCPTCHGGNMQEVDFAMPNGVAPLDPAQIGALFQSDQPMPQFMVQRVWPRMAELLQQAPYDPATHEGFGCMNCHATASGG